MASVSVQRLYSSFKTTFQNQKKPIFTTDTVPIWRTFFTWKCKIQNRQKVQNEGFSIEQNKMGDIKVTLHFFCCVLVLFQTVFSQFLLILILSLLFL